jgi:ABC-type transport system substrate-binding protein
VNVKVKVLPEGPYVKALTTHPYTYSVFGGPWGGTFGFTYWVTNYDARCGHVFNTSDYCNRAVSKLIDQAFLASGQKQQSYWDQLARLWVRDAPRIPIYSPDIVAVLKKGFGHYQVDAIPFGFWDWGR